MVKEQEWYDIYNILFQKRRKYLEIKKKKIINIDFIKHYGFM